MAPEDALTAAAEREAMLACEAIHITAESFGLSVEDTARVLTDSGYTGLAVEYRSWAEVWA